MNPVTYTIFFSFNPKHRCHLKVCSVLTDASIDKVVERQHLRRVQLPHGEEDSIVHCVHNSDIDRIYHFLVAVDQ